MSESTIRILNWKRFNARKDIEKPSWFRVENTIMFDRKLYRLDAEEKWIWVCLLAEASRENSDTFIFDPEYFALHFGVSVKKLNSAIQKLEENQCVQLSTRGRNADVTSTCLQTDKQTDTQTDTQEREHADVPSTVFSPEDLQELWNSLKGPKQPGCRKLSTARRKKAASRIRENPDREYWETIIRAMAADDWCNARHPQNKTWVADFDFLLGEKAVRFYDRGEKQTQPILFDQQSEEEKLKAYRAEKEALRNASASN